MEKIINFTINTENLFAKVRNFRAVKNYEDALKILHHLESVKKSHEEQLNTYRLLGQTYSDMELYSISLEYWYKFLDISKEDTKEEAYNALGAVYYLDDNKDASCHYFNLQMEMNNDNEYYYDEVMLAFLNEALNNNEDKKENGLLKLVYSKQEELEKGYKELITIGDEKVAKKKYLDALEDYLQVPKTYKNYFDVAGKIAICYFMTGDKENAKKYMDIALSGKITETFILYAMMEASKDCNEDEVFNKIVDYIENFNAINDYEVNYKILIMFCQLNDDLRVKKYAELLLKTNKYDTNVLHVYGIALYNLGDKYGALKVFKKTNVYEYTPITKNYVSILEDELNNGVKFADRLEYIFDYQLQIHEKKIDEVQRILGYKGRICKLIHLENLIEYCDWAFIVGNEKFMLVIVDLLARYNTKRSNEVLSKLLLKPSVDSSMKSIIVSLLTLNEFNKKVGLIFEDIYIKMRFEPLRFEHLDSFVQEAYSYLIGKVCFVEYASIIKIKDNCLDVLYSLYDKGIENIFKNTKIFGAYLYYSYSGKRIKNKKDLCYLFDITVKELNDAIACVEIERL